MAGSKTSGAYVEVGKGTLDTMVADKAATAGKRAASAKGEPKSASKRAKADAPIVKGTEAVAPQKKTPAKKAPAKKEGAKGTPAKKAEAQKVEAKEAAPEKVETKESEAKPVPVKNPSAKKAKKAKIEEIKAEEVEAKDVEAAQTSDEEDDEAEFEDARSEVGSPLAAKVGSGRAAAQGLSLKEARAERSSVKDGLLATREEPVAEDEAAALLATRASPASESPERRLGDFSLFDTKGIPEPIDAVGRGREIFAAGLVLAVGGEASKASRARVARLGPVRSFSLASPALVAASPGASAIVLRTDEGSYLLLKPAASYRKVAAPTLAAADISQEVAAAAAPARGGDASVGLDAVVAALARARLPCVRTYGSAREALVLHARFVLTQLETLGAGSGPTADGLRAELARVRAPASNGIRIASDGGAAAGRGGGSAAAKGKENRSAAAGGKEGEAADADMADADEEFARQLQAQMDAEASGRVRGREARGTAAAAARGSAAPYVRVSEAEIADDYPAPRTYDKVEEEMDELVLADEDVFSLDPEDLPRRVLSDFSVYNADGMLSSLELLPMWSGVDPDVELYASGVVAEDDGDFTVGGFADGTAAEPASAGGSGSGSGSGSGPAPSSAPAPSGGVRLFLSQIKEWVVEAGADLLFINVRTDVAWYRLAAPDEAYAPWFAPVLRAARLATKTLGWLSAESRASKLSFADVIKRLADEAKEVPEEARETHPTFVSRHPERIERFLVVHGAIVLNQFTHFPNKTVARSAFASTLRERMQAVRHAKLYRRAVRAALVGRRVNANPMKDRATGARAKPMTATATAMVRSVWQAYFSHPGGRKAGLQDPVGDAATAPAAEGDAAAAARAGEASLAVASPVAEDENEEDEAAEEAEVEAALEAEELDEGARVRLVLGDALFAEGKAGDRQRSSIRISGAGAGAKATLGLASVRVGDVLAFRALGDDELAETRALYEPEDATAARDAPGEEPLGLVQAIFEDPELGPAAQLRLVQAGAATVLGDAASADELFLTESLSVRPLAHALEKVRATRLARAWDAGLRLAQAAEDGERRARNAERAAAGEPLEYFWRSQWVPSEGMFRRPADDLSLGDKLDPPARPHRGIETVPAPGRGAEAKALKKDGVVYVPGSFFFVSSAVFPRAKGAERAPVELPAYVKKNRHWKGSHDGLRAWGVARLVRVLEAGEGAPVLSSAERAKKAAKAAAVAGKAAPKAAPAKKAAAKTAAAGKVAKKATKKKVEELSSASEAESSGSDSEDEVVVATKATASRATAPSKGGSAKKAAKAARKKAASESEASGSEYEAEEEAESSESEGEPDASEAGEAGRGGVRKAAAGAAARKPRAAAGPKVSAAPTLVVERYWRPEDVSQDAAYEAESYHDLFASPAGETVRISAADVVGPVRVVAPGASAPAHDVFRCVGTYDASAGSLSNEAPAEFRPEDADATDADAAEDAEDDDGVALQTLDIFAGCGGLSEGMHQAKAAIPKWAIEYERPAADAFKLNNPDAAVFCDNCNVLLHAAMDKAGLAGDCEASPEAAEASARLDEADRAALPLPGEVDFICGGPPCQGYSGMNRFNKGNWSMVQNSMVMAFLSYADFYRPRYFLLENVRNFVLHNKSFTFRLTLRSLLEMGYQVRFGVLNAGNFGVAQSRKRTFIWAAAPGDLLPDWPHLLHRFRTPQLSVALPGGARYTAVPQREGAPLRPVTVRDAIADLPAIPNGHEAEEMAYTSAPVSAFQRKIRGRTARLTDHISKCMNPLNLERCRCIPKGVPGADWRVLEEIVRADPSRELYQGSPLVPWCLPNTADRHNGWRGLYGRLDPQGHFPTSTTDPQPMGKVGQVFHPDQDRIISVRECARAQGFPDAHRFSGNVHARHRQVGNAVPPPLAAALGRELRKKLELSAQRLADERAAELALQL